MILPANQASVELRLVISHSQPFHRSVSFVFIYYFPGFGPPFTFWYTNISMENHHLEKANQTIFMIFDVSFKSCSTANCYTYLYYIHYSLGYFKATSGISHTCGQNCGHDRRRSRFRRFRPRPWCPWPRPSRRPWRLWPVTSSDGMEWLMRIDVYSISYIYNDVYQNNSGLS